MDMKCTSIHPETSLGGGHMYHIDMPLALFVDDRELLSDW